MKQYFYILTLQATLSGNPTNYTSSGEANVPKGCTQQDCYRSLTQGVVAEMREKGFPVEDDLYSVMFFYFAPMGL